ncbi:uncharacterized protein OCT59_000336 [Rhizophagus irregularis]|uniref:uncharacterized protein n=1 Tax=Rhizophagus irregularis TaxID=588596 RepID=UPI000CAFE49F|nr:hypothetical protein OCT59_000336 [Rhizophagus irregularis]GET66545.1 hypothetical protein GLOIN_2v1879292 [Rhizophagus irregularis DAOM 181602=DAOM 197198]
MACSKIFSGDLPELTNEIIQYFRNDFSALHSCILVNRLWCRLAIPLLWENPFSKNLPKNYHFIEIYLHKISENDKIKLNEYCISTYSLFPSNTLFNYPSFIKCLDTYNVCNYIESWAANKIDSNFVRFLNLIFLALIKIFIENEVNLHTFEFDDRTLNKINSDCFNSTIQLILQNPNFVCNIKNLKIYLLCYNYYDNVTSLIKCLYISCTSISSLYIDSLRNPVEKDISKLIDLQQNLKKIFFYFNGYYLNNVEFFNCSNTLKTIIFSANRLSRFNFNEMFEKLNVLESIHILYYCSLDSTFIQQVINLTKPFKLKSLFIYDNSLLQIELLKLLLQKSGNYLENVGINSIDNKLQLYELFKIYCNNIKFLSIFGLKEDLNIYLVLDLIKNIQQNLNYLHLQLIINSKLILENLGQILPYRLEYLRLELKYNINDLEVFFKNSQNIFIKKLLIKNLKYLNSEEMLLPCIKKYVMKEKRVTYLAIDNILNNKNCKGLFDLKNEVKEFKFHGIQVKDYNDLCIKVDDFISEMY